MHSYQRNQSIFELPMDHPEFVLLIDDDRITNYLNERIISKLYPSLEVVVKNNGKEGLLFIEALLEQNRPMPTYIFLDLNMPVLNGFDFLLAFNKLGLDSSRTTITILTTSSNADDVEKINLLGNYSYVTKPLTNAKLTAIFDSNLFSELSEVR
ncbi:MAG TPA: response regulator [Cytophagaceae bacterium]|jgi:CheY-like chemotaxis protein